MKYVKSMIRQMIMIMSAVAVLVSSSLTVYAAQPYIHDPMANPEAAKDIVVDTSAVYGYAPSPNSSRLKDYVEYDWSDPVFVEKMRQQREEYHDSMKQLYSIITTMRTAGASVKDIAIAVSTRRNEMRLESYKGDPEGLAKVKKSNLENYGNENGGSPEFFYNKYGSWEMVIEKALSANEGADACLGLYDKYYDTYFFAPAPTNSDNKNTVQSANTVTSADYTVESGDSLSTIAGSVLKDRTKWTLLYDLNKDTVKDPNLIYPGQVLKTSL